MTPLGTTAATSWAVGSAWQGGEASTAPSVSSPGEGGAAASAGGGGGEGSPESCRVSLPCTLEEGDNSPPHRICPEAVEEKLEGPPAPTP